MKRILCVLLSAALLLTVAVTVASADAVLYGDIREDGKINNRDLGALQQYLNDLDVTINEEAADVFYDGKVNNRDLGILQQYLNDIDVTLGPKKPVVPPVELPSVGYDIDGKERIIVDAIAQDGYIVTVTLHNYSDKWMTEETSCVAYTCTDAEGNELTIPGDKYFGVLYLGMLEVGDVCTYTITLPEGTAKLEFGDFDIIYWSQWA